MSEGQLATAAHLSVQAHGTVAFCASYQPSYIIFYQLEFLDTTVKVGCNLYMVSHSKLLRTFAFCLPTMVVQT